ncbi:MAG: acetyl-CoA carboxylase, biotin carboxyl carrier protein [Legionellales bacterium]|nr:acetyl-CoA carboxylase, biotin carboxyl carrier protein [Legionellales bacterium]OUX67668.1 MAG: acetyl-CoA carboxylase, biotin carboxyl carrier protein [bacterium TMED178]|tara:strand:- start:5653 stop:6096 length:444 start_codon:yes stop_codon:yes gene_type:complete
MEIDLKYVKKMIALAKDSGLKEIEVAQGDRSFRFVVSHDEPRAVERVVESPKKIEAPKEVEKQIFPSNLHSVKSPMVGTFYLAPSPDDQPFVNLGQRVQEGDVICLIEAMKMFNKVRAERSGILKRVLIEDGGVVEYDQTLFEFEEA